MPSGTRNRAPMARVPDQRALASEFAANLSARRGARPASRTTPVPGTGQGRGQGQPPAWESAGRAGGAPYSQTPTPHHARRGLVPDGPRDAGRPRGAPQRRGNRALRSGEAPTSEAMPTGWGCGTSPFFDSQCPFDPSRAPTSRLRGGRGTPNATSGARHGNASLPYGKSAPDRGPGPPPPVSRKDVRTRTPLRYRTRTRGRPCCPAAWAPGCR